MAHEDFRMNDNIIRNSKLIGKHSPDKTLQAMPIRVVYRAVERIVSPELRGKEYVFRYRIPERFTPGFDRYPWDAYKLRGFFEEIKSPEEAPAFLSSAGIFRKVRVGSGNNLLTWSEFAGWQSLIRSLRLRKSSEGFPTLGTQRPECKDIFLESEFLSDATVQMKRHIWAVSEETFLWIQGISTGLHIRRDMYLSYEETSEIFSAPGADVPGSRAWEYAHARFTRHRADRAAGDKEGRQKLLAQVVTPTALDAILATVYIDSLRGTETRRCALPDCERVFEIVGHYGKEYCDNNHAHLASVRRIRGKLRMKKSSRQN